LYAATLTAAIITWWFVKSFSCFPCFRST